MLFLPQDASVRERLESKLEAIIAEERPDADRLENGADQR